MEVYTIDYNTIELMITGYNSLDEATATLCPEGCTRLLAREEKDLEGLDNPTLLRLYNFKKTGKPVPKIKSRASAIKSIWALFQHKGPIDDQTSSDSDQTSSGSDQTSSGSDLTSSDDESIDADKTSSIRDEAKEDDMASKKRASTKKAKAAKAATKVKRTAAAGPRGEKTLKIKAMLERKNGCTSAEVLELTGWPAVSMPAMAKACGLKLRKEKEKGSGKPTRYFGT